ncbi:type I-C CRISPR-associated protein Cas7/Csd2 [Dehalogenimonas sp. THU2]|uniref:type I-C CRISPR-associated protein Cas7/Csd2 n=1 Tax=Dehalogenimonas sp. THU2 TaxID=3151121 RepID=UPI003218DECE
MIDSKKRYDFALLFDVKDGNPNGDPDAGNSPRIDPETGHGLVSDVSLKRKIRNYVTLAKQDADGNPFPGYDIYVKEKAILNNQHGRAYTAEGLKPTKTPDQETQDKVQRWMCQNFFDIRMFGAVMTTEVNCGQVRGPVQYVFGRSVDPIVSLEQALTRMAVTTEAESKKQEGGNRTMGRKEIVPYGLYVSHGFYSPFLAAKTGFSDDDLKLLWQSMGMMFDVDRSAARGEMAKRKLIIFEHDSPLGSAPAHELFERISITRRDQARPARAFTDYVVTVNRDNLPAGIAIHEV